MEEKETSQKTFNKMKLIMLGDSGVGKTTFVNTLFGKFNENTISSLGTMSRSLKRTINNQDYKIDVWDTAGQEKYRSIIPQYSHDADGVILMFDLFSRDSFKSLDSFQELIQTDSMCVLVGNKNDKTINIKEEEIDNYKLKYNYNYFSICAFKEEDVKDVIENVIIKVISSNVYQKKCSEKSTKQVNIEVVQKNPQETKCCV